ncbi:MAG: hypothetical protein HY917_05260 [Candidatus Diapherotrites archaeon]|nr:hypothetical protein [Candidatus Diapherotrites archaeon]
MSTYKQHLDLANERFQTAEELYAEEKVHTAAHLFINAAINYHNAVCQKFLNRIPTHKPHSDTGYFQELSDFLGNDLAKYRSAYEFLMAHKSQSDYGAELSLTMAKQINRRAHTIREIAEHHLQ